MKLERIYLMNVILYLDSLSTFKKFVKVSKDCKEAFEMLHKNPNYSFRTTEEELKIFSQSKSLQTIEGHFDDIKDFKCRMYTTYAEPYDSNKSYYEPSETHRNEIEDKIKEINNCCKQIVTLKLFATTSYGRFDFSQFEILQKIFLSFENEFRNHRLDAKGIREFLVKNFNIKALLQLKQLKQITIQSIKENDTPVSIDVVWRLGVFKKFKPDKVRVIFIGDDFKGDVETAPDNYYFVSTQMCDVKRVMTKSCFTNFPSVSFLNDHWKQYYPGVVRLNYFNKSISHITSITNLKIENCTQNELSLPTSLRSLELYTQCVRTLPECNGIDNLLHLSIHNVNIFNLPSSLTSLNVKFDYFNTDTQISLFTSFETLPNLKELVCSSTRNSFTKISNTHLTSLTLQNIQKKNIHLNCPQLKKIVLEFCDDVGELFGVPTTCEIERKVITKSPVNANNNTNQNSYSYYPRLYKYSRQRDCVVS
ncbi:F-box domain containing protein [Entamoeba marina]